MSILASRVHDRGVRGAELNSNDSKKVVFFSSCTSYTSHEKNRTISDFSFVLTGTHIKLCINPNLVFGVEDAQWPHWPPRVRRQSPKVWQLLILPSV